MSCTMAVFSVPLARMRALLGSGRREVFAEAVELLKDFEVSTLEEPSEGQLTAEEVVALLLGGGPYRSGAESLYAYGFMALCWVVGEQLAGFTCIRWRYVAAVDQHLGSVGFPLRVADLAAGGAPFEFPG